MFPLALKRFAKTVHTACCAPIHCVIFYLVNIIHFLFFLITQFICLPNKALQSILVANRGKKLMCSLSNVHKKISMYILA